MYSRLNSKYLSGAIVVLCGVFLCLLWFNYFHQKEEDKKETIAAAIERNNNLAVALEQYTVRTIHNADMVLQLVKQEFEDKGSAIDITRLLFQNSMNKEVFKGVAIIDRNGKVEKTNLVLDTIEQVDLSDREYFRFHKTQENDMVHVSKPLISRTIGKPVVVISRRLNDDQGRFSGVVSLQIDPATFTSFYAQANLLPNDIISLIAPDGITYARRTGSVESSGENISRSPLFQYVVKKADSFYLAKDAIRGIPTWFSYRRLRNYPIIATVGRAEADVLQNYHKRTNLDLRSTTIMSLLVTLFFAVLLLLMRHRERATRVYLEEQQRFQQELTRQVIAAQEKERESIGHELHDNVNQVLTSSKLYLELAQSNTELKEELISKSIDLIASSISEIRNLSHRLSSPTLGTRSLIDSLSSLCETVALSSGLAVQFHSPDHLMPMPMEEQLILYRIAQEQMHNIVKHAAANNVDLNLEQSDHFTIMTIVDDGKGFDTQSKHFGMGLNNITNRAEMVHGEAKIRSSPGEGCVLQVKIPRKE